MKITQATSDQATLLTELALHSKAVWGYDDEFIKKCRDELTITAKEIVDIKNIILVGYKNEKIVGFVYFKQKEGKEAILEALFVDPDHMRKGYGNKLFASAVKRAKELGLNSLQIDSDPHATAFYEKLGAEKIGEVPSGSIAGRMLPQYLFRIG